MSRTDEIRLERLEERLKDLEINVGAIMSELNLVAVATRSSCDNYREGCINHIHMNNSGKPKMINSEILKDGISLDKETEERLLNDIISEAKLLNSLELIKRINIGLKKIGVEAKIVVNPFETSATIYHTYGNNKGVDTEKPQCTIPLHNIIR